MAGSGHAMHRAGGGISPEFGGTTAAIFPPPVEAEETWPMAAAGIFSGFFCGRNASPPTPSATKIFDPGRSAIFSYCALFLRPVR